MKFSKHHISYEKTRISLITIISIVRILVKRCSDLKTGSALFQTYMVCPEINIYQNNKTR